MSYNRLGSRDDDDRHPPMQRYQSPTMDPRYQQPPQSYQLDDRPYGGPLEIPMGPGPGPGTPSDRLQAQPTYSVDGINNSFGHNEAYDAGHPSDYTLNPEEHHDSYFNQPYDPHMQQRRRYWQDEEDNHPMLQPANSFGPDPHQDDYTQQNPFTDDLHNAPTPAPQQAPIRRWKTVKEVQLYDGNLVLDCPVPPRLLNQVPHVQPPERDEFTHMRYSAATCDPADFAGERFTLRQRLFAKPRHTELFIVITMYNEHDELFARTMIGVIKNIEHMNSRTNSKTWGKDAWKKIVVCVVSDGRSKINPRTRAVLASMGVFQDGIAKQQVNGRDVTAHIYEYTTQMSLELKKGAVNVRRGNTPIQMLFCLKEKNQKKINSHRWFFQAFGAVLNPNICVLIDAGTRPGKDSIYQLWKAFDLEPMCGGACGEIKAMLEHGKQLIRPLVATQNFEYKMSNILDKPLESAFGFITVLPGAFSAYRYVALLNDKTGHGPLEKYFLGEKMHGANAGIFTANMYLAEDRILCFELVSKRNCSWILQYVKSATGETDVPTEMSDFIMQRRRWLNGSFFAAVYALVHSFDIFRSNHSIFRKMAFLVEFAYQTISMIFAWFALGNFYLVFALLTKALGDKALLGTAGDILSIVFNWAYIATLITCFLLALGNRPKGSNRFYGTMVWFWVFIMAYLMFASVFITVRAVQQETKDNKFTLSDLVKNPLFFNLIVSMASTYILWFVVSFLFFDPWHMFTSFIQYLLMTPTYINILNVYAFCNTHDVSWGTKGDDKPPKLGTVEAKPGKKFEINIPEKEEDLNSQYENELRLISTKYVEPKAEKKESEVQEDYYKGFRSGVVMAWLFSNLALAAVVLQAGGLSITVDPDKQQQDKNDRAKIYLAVVLWSVAGLSLFRFIGAMWFLIVRMFRGV